jgi:hypothetical protein
MVYVPATPRLTADSAAHQLATQAENYRRALACGSRHDLAEARSLLKTARALVNVLEEIQAEAQAKPQADTPR